MHALPARETIRRFGSFDKFAKLLNLSVGTVHAWTETKKSKADAIPRWWYESIKALAEREGVTLPRPLPAPKPRAKKRRAS